MKDNYIGKFGSNDREEYDYELRMDVLDKMIKTATPASPAPPK